MISINPDIQSSKLSHSIKQLLSVLKDESAIKILEINNDAHNKEKYSLLIRLERSIDQFIKRDINLFYIGFLGHFSSGKSSTINSLLKLKGKKDERIVNINPTDDQITLITSAINIDQVIKLVRTGQIPILTQTLDDNAFLDSKVIMDTPGSGDPSLIEEIVRDSLPLCDLIVYCMSATNPFTNTDIPLLREKEKNLYNIPTLYIITRGNEFKKVPLQHLSEDNFDLEFCHKALSQLASRMKEAVSSIKIEYDDFIVIDNKENYNINLLNDRINFYSDPNSSNVINLHSHKIDFFYRTSTYIKEYFSNSVLDKLTTIEAFVNRAQTNIDDYQRKSQIGIEKLIVNWKNVDDKIRQVIDGAIAENGRIQGLLITKESFLGIENVKLWHKAKIDTFKNECKVYSYKLSNRYINKFYDKKELCIKYLIENIESYGSIKKDDLNQYLTTIEIRDNLLPIEYLDSKFLHEYFSKLIYDYLKERYENLKKCHESIITRVKTYNPYSSVDKYIEGAKITLSEIFQTYSEAVKVYRIAAFSNEAKTYIKKLGLSDKLDFLDTQELDIESHKKTAEDQILHKYDIQGLEFKKKCDLLNVSLTKIPVNTSIIEAAINEVELHELQQNFLDSVKLEYAQTLKKYDVKANDFLLGEISYINSQLLTKKIEQEEEIKELKKQRNRYYLKRALPTFFLILVTVFFFLFPDLGPNISLFWQLVLGVMSNVAFAAVSALYATKGDKFIEKKSAVSAKYIEESKKMIQSTINTDYDSYKKNSQNEFNDELNHTLQNMTIEYFHSISLENINDTIKDFHKNIIENEKKVKQIITEYTTALTIIKNTANGILNDTISNKKILIQQSEEIMSNSIKPSFQLLDDTKKSIANVKAIIDDIHFN